VKDFDSSFRDLELTPQIGFQSQHIRHIALSLLSELSEANVMSRLYADSLAVGLAMQVARQYSYLNGLGGNVTTEGTETQKQNSFI